MRKGKVAFLSTNRGSADRDGGRMALFWLRMFLKQCLFIGERAGAPCCLELPDCVGRALARALQYL